jgi:hypothetical protein
MTPAELAILKPRTGSAKSPSSSVSGSVDHERIEGDRLALLTSLVRLIQRRFYVLLSELGITRQILLTKQLIGHAVSERISEINSARKAARNQPLAKKQTFEQDLRSDYQRWRSEEKALAAPPANRATVGARAGGDVATTDVAEQLSESPRSCSDNASARRLESEGTAGHPSSTGPAFEIGTGSSASLAAATGSGPPVALLQTESASCNSAMAIDA